MNDPGLDKPIAAGALDIEGLEEGETKAWSDVYDPGPVQDEEKAGRGTLSSLEPTRWWLASTAIPLICGTFGPMASAFSICSLAQNWRQILPPGGNGNPIDIPDPAWFLAVNAVSLAVALSANIALLLNMARRISFKIAQPVTIFGWYISSFLLIALFAFEAHEDSKPENADQILTQAFYYAIIAAAIYFVLSTSMLITVYGALMGHYERGFRLTTSQRTLMLQTISFMIYLTGGAAVYTRVEGWRFLDAVYWADYTLLTIGIGDYAPVTHLGRSLLFPYGVGGILILGLVVGSIRSLMLERGKKNMTARLIEKTRRTCVRQIQKGKSRKFTLTQIDADDGVSERERRRQEFEIMRTINHRAATKRKWLSLGTAAMAWLGLWLLGALAFSKSEESQGWTYFDALYFAYTSLLTIGYGDLAPTSNWGRPFFVFWSLLAVPTLTILISSMGDTIVKLVHDGTIYLGEVTVLPGEMDIKKKLRIGYRSLLGKDGNLTNGDSEKPPTSKGPDDGSMISQTSSSRQGRESGRRLYKPEIRSPQHHHFLLAQELRFLYRTMRRKPNKRYGYDEWAYYLDLIGEDEAESSFHRDATIKDPRSKGKNGVVPSSSGDATNGSDRKWSWIGPRSPLLGEKDETEWLLEALARKLENGLKEHYQRHDRLNRRNRQRSESRRRKDE